MCPFDHIGNNQASNSMCRSPGAPGPCSRCGLVLLDNRIKFIGVLDPQFQGTLDSATIRVRTVPPGLMTMSPDGPVLQSDYYEVNALLEPLSSDEELALDLAQLPSTGLPVDASFDFVLNQNGVTQALSAPLGIVELPN
jgi:hypothetical protein